tara:strand:+ start:61 stop:201 length:141 start_codon:yes stop_codon:yes gene_type:complete
MEAFIAELNKAFLVAQDAVLSSTFFYQVIVIVSICLADILKLASAI